MIFESPDGGKTVYSRQPCSTERTLIYESDEIRTVHRWTKFKDIVKLAETEPTLNDILSKAEMLYELLKNDGRD